MLHEPHLTDQHRQVRTTLIEGTFAYFLAHGDLACTYHAYLLMSFIVPESFYISVNGADTRSGEEKFGSNYHQGKIFCEWDEYASRDCLQQVADSQ